MKKNRKKKVAIRKPVKVFILLSLAVTLLSFADPNDYSSLKHWQAYLGDYQHMKMMFTNPSYRYVMTEAPLCALPNMVP